MRICAGGATARLLVAVCAAAVLTISGCDRTANGSARWDPAQAGTPLRADDANHVMLDPAGLSQIVGARLAVVADRTRPISKPSTAPHCSPLASVGMQAFVGDDWSGFHLLLVNDGRAHQHVDTEAVAIYSDDHRAATLFASVAKGLRACDGEVALAIDENASWKFAVNDLTADAVLWNKKETDVAVLWVCYGGARLRVNAILQAMSCQGDDNGKGNVAAILDRMSANAWNRSGRG
jgi:hypothetical protein